VVAGATGAGRLLQAVAPPEEEPPEDELLDEPPPELEDELVLPPSAARLRAQLFALHAVQSERVDDDGAMRLRVRLPYSRLERMCREAGVKPPPPRAVAASFGAS